MTPTPLSGFHIDFFGGAYALTIKKNLDGSFIWTMNDESTNFKDVSEVLEHFNMIKGIFSYDTQGCNEINIKLPTLPKITITDENIVSFIANHRSLLEKILNKWYTVDEEDYKSMPPLIPSSCYCKQHVSEEEVITPHDPLYHYSIDSPIIPDIFPHLK